MASSMPIEKLSLLWATQEKSRSVQQNKSDCRIKIPFIEKMTLATVTYISQLLT